MFVCVCVRVFHLERDDATADFTNTIHTRSNSVQTRRAHIRCSPWSKSSTGKARLSIIILQLSNIIQYIVRKADGRSP
eukprot:m.21700 g.21700  ORF g.21700 m.21700 type:complete len:78 (+) comp13506_c0_seq1:235-468(+)